MREFPFDAGSVSLNVARGPIEGTPLVLLHGVTRCWQDFTPIFPALMARWQVVAVDLRGHGGSGRVPPFYHVIDYVDDIVKLIRETFDEPAIVIGHSLGAMVAAAVAAKAPDRVKALVMEDPTFAMTASRIGEGSFLDLFHAFQPLAGSDRPVAEIAHELAEARIFVPGSMEKARLGDLRNAVSLRFSASCLKRLDRDVLMSAIAGRWLEGYDVTATLRRITCPTLMLQGDFACGGALPDDYAVEIASQIRECLHIRMSRVGHNIHADQPEALLRIVLPFLSSLE